MDLIDLVLVEYAPGMREICQAPKFTIEVGYKVQTSFGTGEVIDFVTTLADNIVYQLFNKAHKVQRIAAIVNPLKYEENENDLSDW